MTPKPRIYFRSGWWWCETPVPHWGLGVGRTPRLAYLDWQYS